MVILSVLVLMAGWRVFAQGSESADRPTQMALKLKEMLSLSKGQTERVVAIMTLSRQRAAQDRLAFKGDRQALVKAKWERIDETDKEIEAILTEKQMQRYQALKRDSRERFRERMKERMAYTQ
jgi:hypothetical protein